MFGGLLYVCSGMHTVQFGSSTYSYLRWNWIDDRCPVSESDSKLSDTLTSHTHAAEGLGRVARSSDKNNHSLRRQRQPWTPGFQLLLFQQFFGKSEISIHCHFGVLWLVFLPLLPWQLSTSNRPAWCHHSTGTIWQVIGPSCKHDYHNPLPTERWTRKE